MATPFSSPANKLVARYPAGVQTLAAGAARLIRRLVPRVEEQADPAATMIAYGFGPGYKGMVCTLILSRTGVKLGLVRGSDLPDPHGLLEGRGKVHRYIQLKAVDDLQRPGVSELISASYAAWRERQIQARVSWLSTIPQITQMRRRDVRRRPRSGRLR